MSQCSTRTSAYVLDTGFGRLSSCDSSVSLFEFWMRRVIAIFDSSFRASYLLSHHIDILVAMECRGQRECWSSPIVARTLLIVVMYCVCFV